ncbi:MAG TPA: YCF48-related protein [Coriobacteriia bacterium]|nr:YCF48-related protein [Coriobacteriia bacterium]
MSRRALVGLITVAILAVSASTIWAVRISTGPAADRSWFWHNQTPQGNSLRATTWIDANNGWAVGTAGVVLKTSDGGRSWIAQDARTTRDLFGSTFVDASTGWVVGASGLVEKTLDGGTSWTAQSAGTANLRGISFGNSSTGVAVGDVDSGGFSTVRYTTDGGTTWRSSSATTTVDMTAVQMLSPTTGWATGGSGMLLKTTDGGATWTRVTLGTSAALTSVSFEPNGVVGYVVGNAVGTSWTMYKTTNSGSTWTAVTTLGTTGAVNLYSVSAASSTHAVVVGANGTIRWTSDGTATWTTQSQNGIGPTALRNVRMFSTTSAYAVGDLGAMFYTASAGRHWFTLLPGSDARWNDSSFITPDAGWVVGENGTIGRTANAGRTWEIQAGGPSVLRAVWFTSATNGWLAGDGGLIEHTTDGSNWSAQTSGTTVQLNDMYFTSATNGVAVGAGGTIVRTTNGGTTWTTATSRTGQNLNGVWFASPTIGYVCGTQGSVRRTTDGGATWNGVNIGPNTTLNSIWGSGTNTVWVGAANGSVYKSTNGGSSWSTINPGIGTNPVNVVRFADANTGWIASTYGLVRKTTNGGTTWSSQNAGIPTATSDPALAIRGGSAVSTGTAYLVGDGGILRRTVTGGASWTSVQRGVLGDLNGLSFPSADYGWAAGSAGSMLYTADAGQTWARLRTGTNSNLAAVSMSTTTTGWAVGDNGTIRKTTDGGLTWTAQTSGVSTALDSVASAGVSRAVAAGAGVVRYTTNGGTSWTAASTLPTTTVTGLWMTGPNTVWASSTRSGANSVLWTSANGGSTWTSRVATPTANLWDVNFVDATTGFAVGDSGVVLRTTDAGATWVRRSTPTTATLNAVRFRDASNGVVVGANGTVLRTNDGGTTWIEQSSGTNLALAATAYPDSGAFAVGAGGTLLASSQTTPPVTSFAISPNAPDGNNGWYKTAPTITLSTGASGVIFYSWVSEAGPFQTYSAPVSADEGTQTISYYSTDLIGTAEAPQQYTVQTDITAPSVPSALAVGSVDASNAALSWDASSDNASGVDHYEVYLNGLPWLSTPSTSAQFTGLTQSTMYSATVAAVDFAGNVSAVSAAASFVTPAVDVAPYETVVSVDPIDADGLNGWYVDNAPKITMAALPMGGGPRTTYYAWGDIAGPYSAYSTTLTASPGVQTLYYSTHDDALVRSDEPTHSQTYRYDPVTPDAPVPTASAVDYQSISVSWPDVTPTVSGIDHYEVLVDGLLRATTTSTTAEIAGLQSSTTYSVVVRVVNGAGTFSDSSAASVTTSSTPLPTPPPAFVAKSPSASIAYLCWMPSENTVGAVSYRVWQSENGVDYSAVATTTGGLYDCSYIVRGLRSSSRYWFAISTVDTRGESSLTDTSSAMWAFTAPTTTVPDRVLGVSALGLNSTVFLSWVAPDNPAVAGYVVRRGMASMSTMTTITAAPTTGTAYFDTTAQNGEKYYYQVLAVDEFGGVGLPSIETRAAPLAPYPVNQPSPHDHGQDSACICHATHSSTALAPLVRFPRAERNTLCKACHAPANSQVEFTDPLVKSKHPMGASVTAEEPYTCVTCHVPLKPTGETELKNLMRTNSTSPCSVVTTTPAGDSFCYSCHGENSTLSQGDMTVFEQSSHGNVSAPGTGADIKCDRCHESHVSRNESLLYYSGFMVCMQCHTASAANPNQVDILSKLTMNEGANSKHPLLPQDQTTGARMTCQNCHNTHTVSSTFPLVDPHNPSPSGSWPNPRSDEKAFCFSCHDGQALPTSVETSPWAPPVYGRSSATTTTDIQTSYQTNVHGFAMRSESTTTNAYLRTDMGYGYGDVLECRACHDPHGTTNADAIQDRVTSRDGSKVISGVLTTRVPGGGRDYRFFCITCHTWDSASHDSRAGTSTVTFPMNCKACHGHMSLSGAQF